MLFTYYLHILHYLQDMKMIYIYIFFFLFSFFFFFFLFSFFLFLFSHSQMQIWRKIKKSLKSVEFMEFVFSKSGIEKRELNKLKSQASNDPSLGFKEPERDTVWSLFSNFPFICYLAD